MGGIPMPESGVDYQSLGMRGSRLFELVPPDAAALRAFLLSEVSGGRPGRHAGGLAVGAEDNEPFVRCWVSEKHVSVVG